MILASGSPRRSELLTSIGIEYRVIVPNIEEILNESLPIHEQVMDLAKQKADAIGIEDELILAADTIVVIGDVILGKPVDTDDAIRMLKLLSDKTHKVFTGVCLKDGSNYDLFYGETDITFKKLSDKTIEEYVKTGEPLDKAGSYGIQKIGRKLVESYDGDYHNIVGLPLKILKEHL